MRLRDMFGILSSSVPVLRSVITSQRTGELKDGAFKLTGATILIETLHELATVPNFEDAQAVAEAADKCRVSGDAIIYHPKEPPGDIYARLLELQERAKRLMPLVEKALPLEEPLSISIRLVPAQSLDDLIDRIEQIKRVIGQPTARLLNEHIGFGGFDVGSAWITIVGISIGTVRFVMWLLNAALAYREKAVELEKREKEAELYIAQVDYINAVKDTNKKLLDGFVRQQAETLAKNSAVRDVGNEELNILLNSIKELDKMIQDGAIIRHALNAPPDVKKAFVKAAPLGFLPVPETKLLAQHNPEQANGGK